MYFLFLCRSTVGIFFNLPAHAGRTLQQQSEDYETFLGVMFEEVRRSNGGVQQIDVVVPDGMTAGEVLLVEYLGAHYELIIPEGCEAGMVFQTSVTLPN